MTELINSIGSKIGKMDNRYDYSDDEDDISSSSNSENEGPPPQINIEKTADVTTIKSAFMNTIEKPATKMNSELESIRVGKKNLTDIANSFEKGALIADHDTKVEREKIEIDKDQYSSVKNKFEKPDNEPEKTDRKVEKIERSEADKKRVQKMFFQNDNSDQPVDNNTEQQNSSECSSCGKIVYPMEKMRLKNKVYHRNCFKCSKCQKNLNIQNYSSVENQLYCKFHALEKLHPDLALTYEMAEGMEISNEPEEDEEYALVTKPKSLDPNVIRSGEKLTDDLEYIPNLSDKKQEWANNAEKSAKIEKKAEMESDMFHTGKVKSRLSKFTEGDFDAADGAEDQDENDEDFKNANVLKKSPKIKDELKLDVDAKTLKNKFEQGETMAAGEHSPNMSKNKDLDVLKGTPSVKERFRGAQVNGETEKRKTTPEELLHVPGQLGTVKERFENQQKQQRKSEERNLGDGTKVPANARCLELGNLKAAFEAGGKKKYTEEEVECKKKEHLEREFKRLQLEKQIFTERQKREAEEEAKNVKSVPYDATDEVRQCVELGSIKQRFEEGTLYKSDSQVPKSKTVLLDEEMLSAEGAQKIEAKSIKAKFENNEFGDKPEDPEEKRRNLKAEFDQYKELNESQKQQEETNLESEYDMKTPDADSDLVIAAEHAQKMRAKWDKIQRKEAKKAQKSAANQKRPVQNPKTE